MANLKRFGIDISLYQKGMDLKKAKAEGVEYVIIKSSEAQFADPQIDNNVKAAKDAGLPYGFYHYLRSTSTAGVKAEAEYCAKTVAKYKPFDYPVFVDMEENSIRACGKALVTEFVKTFCNTLEAAGFWSGFYTGLDWYRNALDGAALAKRYSFWLAFWSNAMASVDGVQMWQFGGNQNFIRSNKIAGIICDQDYCYTDYPMLIKAKGLNGHSKPGAAPAPKPAPKPVDTALNNGTKIKLTADAVIYGTTKKFAPWVYNTTYKVVGITDNGNRIAFATLQGVVTGATDKKYVKKV